MGCIYDNKDTRKLMLGFIPDIHVDLKVNFTDNPPLTLNPKYSGGIDISENKVVLRRIVPNEYIFRSNTDYAVDDMKNFITGVTFKLTGMDYLVEQGIISPWAHTTWGGPDYTGEGVIYAPAWSGWDETYAHSHPWLCSSYHKNNVAIYGAFKDGCHTINHSDFTQGGTKLCWAIYTGTALPESQSYFDISEHPLTIELGVSDCPLGPERAEVWDMYDNEGNHIYHKDKTIENCWKEYGLLRKYDPDNVFDMRYQKPLTDADELTGDECMQSYYYVDSENDTIIELTYVPIPVDWKDSPFLFRCHRLKVYNEDFWTAYKEKFNNHTFTSDISYFLVNSNISGELDFHVDCCTSYGLTRLTRNFESTLITKLNCYFTGKLILTELCFRMNKLQEITFDKVIEDENIRILNGMFEYCESLKTLPTGVFHWGNQLTKISYTFEYCKNLTEIPQWGDDRMSPENWINVEECRQAFNGCAVKKIGPVLAMDNITDKSNIHWTFMCPNLEDCRIRHIRGWRDWNFAGENNGCDHANLPNLNAESINYLLQNAIEGKGHTIYYPSTWTDKITDESRTHLQDAGWILQEVPYTA